MASAVLAHDGGTAPGPTARFGDRRAQSRVRHRIALKQVVVGVVSEVDLLIPKIDEELAAPVLVGQSERQPQSQSHPPHVRTAFRKTLSRLLLVLQQ